MTKRCALCETTFSKGDPQFYCFRCGHYVCASCRGDAIVCAACKEEDTQ